MNKDCRKRSLLNNSKFNWNKKVVREKVWHFFNLQIYTNWNPRSGIKAESGFEWNYDFYLKWSQIGPLMISGKIISLKNNSFSWIHIICWQCLLWFQLDFANVKLSWMAGYVKRSQVEWGHLWPRNVPSLSTQGRELESANPKLKF